jgi:EAL domain-containing protein (putative c-di-GMP-specific phosphodiesterase class I)
MDAWMVREASAQLKIWSQKLPNLYLAMNLSNPFLERYTSHALVRFLESAGIGLGKLQLELAEPILLEADQKLLQKLQSLHAAGARICLDNYCGLIPPGDLSKLPLESVKISRQLIMQSDNPEKARLTRAIIRSAQGLGLQVAGNGVESEEQVEFLRSNGCVVAQGYLISEPLPVSEMKKHFDHIKVPTNGRVKEQPPESRL